MRPVLLSLKLLIMDDKIQKFKVTSVSTISIGLFNLKLQLTEGRFDLVMFLFKMSNLRFRNICQVFHFVLRGMMPNPIYEEAPFLARDENILNEFDVIIFGRILRMNYYSI